MIRLVRALGTIALFFLLAGACGGGDGPVAVPSAPTTTPVTESPTTAVAGSTTEATIKASTTTTADAAMPTSTSTVAITAIAEPTTTTAPPEPTVTMAPSTTTSETSADLESTAPTTTTTGVASTTTTLASAELESDPVEEPKPLESEPVAEPKPPDFDLLSAFQCVSAVLGPATWHEWRRRDPTTEEMARTADCPPATHDLRCVDRTVGFERSDQLWIGWSEPTDAELDALEPCLPAGATSSRTSDLESAAGESAGQASASAEASDSTPTEISGVLRSVDVPDAAHRTASESGCSSFVGGECAELAWESVAPLRNGGVSALAVSPTNPDVVYAGFDSNDMSLWRSDDAGATWNQVHNSAHTSAITVSPVDSSTVLYSVIEGWIYHSDSGGTSPDLVVDRRDTGDYRFADVTYAPSDPDVAYTSATGTREGGEQRGLSAVVLSSGDGGRTWQVVGTCDGCGVIQGIAIDSADPRVLVAATDMGIRTSADGGATWSTDHLPRLGSWDNKVLDVAFQPDSSTYLLAATQDHGVYRSTDSGQTWTASNDGLTNSSTHEIHFAPSDGNVAYVTSHVGVFRSDDGGQSWVERSGGLSYRYVHAIAVDSQNPDVAYVGTASELNQLHAEHIQEGLHRGEGLYKTTDGGRTWTLSDSGIEESRLVMMTPHPVRPYEMYTGASAGRSGYVTTDAGDSWVVSSTRASHYPMVSAYTTTFPSVQYLSSLSSRVELIRSADGGHTWTSLSDALGRGVSTRSRANGQYDESRFFHAHTHGVAVAPSDPDVVYAGTISHPSQFEQYTLSGAHIFRSTDGGDTFAEVDNGFPTQTDTSINAIVIHPTDANTVYVMTSSYESIEGIGIYRSADGGNTWTAINDGLDLETNDLQIDPSDPRILYAATAAGVYKSTDGGDTWQLRSNGMLDDLPGFPTRREREVIDLAIDPTNPLVLYATGFKGVYRTKDGGENWYVVNGNLPLESWRDHGAFGHDRNIEVDATGQVVYVLVGTRKPDSYDPVRLYRAVLGTPAPRTWYFDVDGKTVTIDSTSNLSGLVVDLDDDEVRFVAAGPDGTESRTTVTVPSEYLSSPTSVTVDGVTVPAQIDGGSVTFSFNHDGESDVVVR